MDAATVQAMLEQHFELASSELERAHKMYHEDAVLEFPQSGERFLGLENIRGWRSKYPASTSVEFREVRGGGDLWVVELAISYDGGAPSLGVSILELRDDRIARVDLRHRNLGGAGMARPVEGRSLGRRGRRERRPSRLQLVDDGHTVSATLAPTPDRSL